MVALASARSRDFIYRHNIRYGKRIEYECFYFIGLRVLMATDMRNDYFSAWLS